MLTQTKHKSHLKIHMYGCSWIHQSCVFPNVRRCSCFADAPRMHRVCTAYAPLCPMSSYDHCRTEPGIPRFNHQLRFGRFRYAWSWERVVGSARETSSEENRKNLVYAAWTRRPQGVPIGDNTLWGLLVVSTWPFSGFRCFAAFLILPLS